MAGSANYSDFAGMSMDADGNLLWTYQVIYIRLERCEAMHTLFSPFSLPHPRRFLFLMSS